MSAASATTISRSPGAVVDRIGHSRPAISRSAALRKSVLCFLILSTWMYAYWVIADYRAYLYSYSSDLVGLQKAAHLQPRNAEYQRLVGQYFWYLHNWQEAVGAYRRALALNPREPRFWLDLAQFYEMTGDHRNHVAALARALQLDVTHPSLALEIANYYLLGNEIEKALHAFRLVAMYSDDENEVRLAMDRSWRATDDINRVIKDVMPDSPPAHFFLIESLLKIG